MQYYFEITTIKHGLKLSPLIFELLKGEGVLKQ